MTVTNQANALYTAPLLAMIREQAAQADASRSVAPEVVAALKQIDVMRLSASREIGGLEASISAIGEELEAVAAACGSTAWCLWNHLCVFHFYCGQLGGTHPDWLRGIIANRDWVCFPAGAGTSVKARIEGNEVVLNGEASFGSGGRYADWIGVIYLYEGQRGPHFTLLRTDQPGVQIDPTWKAMSLRASATDHVRYTDVRVPLPQVTPYTVRFRDLFRSPEYPVINPRYREDWVGLSDLWLGCMAVGVADAALKEACGGIQDRIAIMGTKMIERPTIHVNLGQAGAMIGMARAGIYAACARVDARIGAGRAPNEGDYLEQLAASMMALRLCDDAMRLILRVLGGNGLREGQAFERRYRDFQAMPIHINAHPDRVSEAYGRHLLGLPADNPF